MTQSERKEVTLKAFIIGTNSVGCGLTEKPCDTCQLSPEFTPIFYIIGSYRWDNKAQEIGIPSKLNRSIR